MDVHLVSAENAYLYRDELEGFFKARYKIYVEEKGWMPENAEKMERDQFDTPAAFYMIGVQDGRVIAGSRFLPTHRPHLLSEVFPNLVDPARELRGPQIAEWTRGFILSEFRGGSGVPIMANFCCAVMEYCLEEGITMVGGIQEIYWLPLWRRFGWAFKPVGEPSEIDGTLCVPGYCEVAEEALISVRKRAKLEQSNLIRKGPIRPFLSEAPHGNEDVFNITSTHKEAGVDHTLNQRWERAGRETS